MRHVHDGSQRRGLNLMRSGLARRVSSRHDDSGQALVLAVIAVAVIAVLVPIVGFNLQTETIQVNRAALSQAALAAAQAGVNDYRTFIDSNPAYYAFVCGTPHGNLALGAGAPGYGCNSWSTVSGTTNEWFHYIPDASQLAQTSTNSGSPHEMLLEVTGRAGSPSDYTYRTVLAGFTLSGILTDSYYSDYEVTDPNQPGAYTNATITTAGVPVTESMSLIQVQYAEQTSPGVYAYYGPESLIDALCVYHTYSENTFIDSLGTVTNALVPGTPIASAASPYYGPYYESAGSGMTITIPNTLPNGTIPVNHGATIFVSGGVGVCAVFGQGIYNASVTFNGIAYTNDQLALCGDPTFNGNPPLESGAPASTPYRDDWPGSQLINGQYYPKGYTYGISYSSGTCSPSSQPIYGPSVSSRAPVLGQNQQLPPTNSGLEPFADGSQPGAQGCLFTGPTMIQFTAGGLMNVWSPLTQSTDPALPVGDTATACGTYSPSQPYQIGIAVPQAPSGGGGVIFVEGEQTSGPNSSYSAAQPTIISTPCSAFSVARPPPANEVDVNVCVPSGLGYVSEGQALNPAETTTTAGAKINAASCIDPYLDNTLTGGVETDPGTLPNATATCEQGDLVVEGEFRGLLTATATNDIIVSRDLTYQCADTSGASNANPGGIAACNAAGTNDELALVPDNELVVSMPLNEPFNSSCTAGTCGTTGSGTAGGPPTCSDDGTEANPNITNVVPWSCDVDTTFTGGQGGNGIVIDAAVVDLKGSTVAQNFNSANVPGGTGADLYQNGTNINFFAGMNGGPGGGYNQIITYDQRLAYENPTGLLQATNTVWNVSSYIVCGTVDTSQFAVTNPGTVRASQSLNCPNQA